MTTLINITNDMPRFLTSFLVDTSICYDVITPHRHRLALLCVPPTWCANAYNKDDLPGGNCYIRFWCQKRDCACKKCTNNAY